MSALGYYDIIHELGKNILIYPLDKCIIKGSSIDLSASKYAWSIKSQKSLVENDVITIPPNDTAIIFTNETIYVSEKICGTYHPKVTLVSKGLSHIATTLDPCFIGISIISMTNLSNTDITIPVGSNFVSIMFYYIKTHSKETQPHNSSGFISSLTNFVGQEDLKNWASSNNWVFEFKELRDKMIKSEKYKEIKALYKYCNKLKFKLSNENSLPIITIGIIAIFLVISLFFGFFYAFYSALLPLIVYCIIELFKNHNDK